MNDSFIITDRSHKYCTILTLNRPEKRNALTIDLMESLCSAILETQNLTEQRAIIFKGAGSVFCAGLDLEEAQDLTKEEQSAKSIGRLLKTIYECPLVTIAAIHGAALAGGAGIICACDLAIAESASIFGFPEVRRGLVAAQIMPYLFRLLPKRLLQELVFLGESIDAQKAHEIHLINKISKTYSSLADALKYVEAIVKGAPKAMRRAKKFMHDLESVDFEKSLKLGFELHREIRQHEESKEGMKAFLEKRPPHWH